VLLKKSIQNFLIKKCLIICATLLLTMPAKAEDIWQIASKPDHHILMRHALAPGTGDPDNFTLGDCTTQRNLNQQGIEQAKRAGARLRAEGFSDSKVYTSQWCRCADTAENLSLADVEEAAVLNSIWTRSNTYKQRKTEELKNFLQKLPKNETVVLVTHYANILALTGQAIGSGQAIVVSVTEKGDEYHVNYIGSLPLYQ
jgi:phosphohistidine phosphatase SixA